MESFMVESVIHGYHQYKVIWENLVTGEALVCECKIGIFFNPHAVAVKKVIHGENPIVGHVPRRISSVFLRKGGTIQCIVNGRRRYSADLIQGGLEVRCKLIFSL